jgi:ribosomal protein L11 methyltransferase
MTTPKPNQTIALYFSFPLELTTSGGAHHSREDGLARFNDYCGDLHEPNGDASYFGTTEGVLLAEQAHDRGYETESWVLDAGEAPHERDWLAREKILELIAYFKTEKAAGAALAWLNREYQLPKPPRIELEDEQDWNATWKKAFTGIDVDENLRVLPPWHEEWLAIADKVSDGTQKYNGILAINPGAGFGTGTHETTQLCLKTLRKLGDLTGKTVLDFGSGSGILGIAAALQGAKVYCVEVDKLANDNAFENAKLNGVQDRIQILEHIPQEIRGGKVDVLVANILRPILIQFAPEIKDCLKAKSELVLSGLIESDVAQVISVYQKDGSPFQIERMQKNEWCALRLVRS